MNEQYFLMEVAVGEDGLGAVVLVRGKDQLQQIIALLTQSRFYQLISLQSLGNVIEGSALLNELIDESKPKGMDFNTF